LDPNGDLYDPKGFTSVQGTSFSVPMAAAAVAMMKQRNPRFTPGQLKSAVVNTAADEVDTDDGRSRAPVIGVGAGKLNTLAAVQTSATVEPATLSFGVIGTSSLPKSLTLRITNTGSAAVTLSLAASGTSDSRARLTLTPASLPLSAGQSASVAVRLEGAQPSPGSYEGAVTVRGGPVSLRVPYLYLVGDGVVFNLISLAGDNFLGVAGEQDWLMAFKAIDRYGVPVRDAAVRFRVMSGGGRINVADDATDVYGIAAARVDLGPRLGEQQFRAETGGLTLDFFGRARLAPVVGSNGVVSAASQQGGGQAAGSYISINGRGLSESTRQFSTASLPLSLSGVSVSFDDAPTSRLSLPGRLTYVSESLINVQIPWEFQGLNSALMKVSIGPGANDSSAIYRVPLSTYAPAFFEYYEPGGRQLLAGLDLSYQVLTLTNRAKRGAAIQLFANGLGPVDNTPPSGEPTPADPLPNTRAEATVTIGDRPAQVLFSGLAPYNVGVYQVNVVVAPDTPVGLQPVVLTIGGVRSKAASIAVE
ncbi:MAG: S8 family serine peptidase, partial [Acidobacteria bacterium]|nr:S8 family serine peptidase [Acidobacteriota bacterium]